MGDEYVDPVTGRKVFAIRGIGLQAWELGPEHWKEKPQTVALDELRREGRLSREFLLHVDPQPGLIEPDAPASFLYITREGSPGLLFVGVEVRNDQLKVGEKLEGDPDLQPIYFMKGRRFSSRELQEVTSP